MHVDSTGDPTEYDDIVGNRPSPPFLPTLRTDVHPFRRFVLRPTHGDQIESYPMVYKELLRTMYAEENVLKRRTTDPPASIVLAGPIHGACAPAPRGGVARGRACAS